MITADNIKAIRTEELFNNQLKVKRMGNLIFSIIGYNYGEAEEKMIGFANEVAKYLNGYFGYEEIQPITIKEGKDVFDNIIVLGKDSEGYFVFDGGNYNTYHFGSDKRTAGINFDSLIYCEACKGKCYCDIL